MSDDLPTAISGTRRQIRELVDGSLEVRIHIDPRFKADFHRLFPSIDAPCALAPLVNDFERIEQKEEEPKGGPLCKLACIWCKDEEFQEWMAIQCGVDPSEMTELATAVDLRVMVNINSRKDLDSNPEAAERFNRLVRIPFMDWSRER